MNFITQLKLSDLFSGHFPVDNTKTKRTVANQWKTEEETAPPKRYRMRNATKVVPHLE